MPAIRPRNPLKLLGGSGLALTACVVVADVSVGPFVWVVVLAGDPDSVRVAVEVLVWADDSEDVWVFVVVSVCVLFTGASPSTE